MNAKKRPPAGSIRQGELFLAPSGQLVLVEAPHEQRVLKSSAASRTRDMFEHAKKNPRKKKTKKTRTPARWFDAILGSKVGRRWASSSSARCNAAYWKLPVAQRARLVRGYLRTRPRVAVAIAKCEQQRAGGPRKSNPPHAVPLVALAYEEQKPGDRRPHVYEHVFEGRRPRVVMKGGKLSLVGGSQYTKNGWIHG